MAELLQVCEQAEYFNHSYCRSEGGRSQEILEKNKLIQRRRRLATTTYTPVN
jgi:hypothetical protein